MATTPESHSNLPLDPKADPDHVSHDASAHGHDEHVGHVVSLPFLFGIFFVLVILTILTVVCYEYEIGGIVLAMSIATTKGLLVALFFMHLWWDRPFNLIIFIGSIVFVAILIITVLIDSKQYYERYVEPREQTAGVEVAETMKIAEDKRRDAANAGQAGE